MMTLRQIHKDAELLLKIKNGDAASFDQLYTKYYKDMYRYGFKICKDKELTEDAIQEIYLNLWELRNKIDTIRMIKLYLIKSLRRMIIRQLVSKNKMDKISCIKFDEESLVNKENGMINKERGIHLHNILNHNIDALPERQQQAIRFRFFDSMEYDQISCTMQVNYQSVLNHVHKSMKTLRSSEEVQRVSHIGSRSSTRFNYDLQFTIVYISIH